MEEVSLISFFKKENISSSCENMQKVPKCEIYYRLKPSFLLTQIQFSGLLCTWQTHHFQP